MIESMTREELNAWAESQDWHRDPWGHFVKGNARLKINRHSVRYEVRSGHEWVRLRSAYLKDVSVSPNGKLAGLTSYGCKGFVEVVHG